MADANSTFAGRLNEALEFRKITDPAESVARLAGTTGRATITARRWISGQSKPRTLAFFRIASDLDIDPHWLYDGGGHTPFQWDMVKKLSAMPPEYLPKLTRYLIRLKNGDPKALRWSAMCERGELSGWQVLDMAG